LQRPAPPWQWPMSHIGFAVVALDIYRRTIAGRFLAYG
jgi:hypothetical protein